MRSITVSVEADTCRTIRACSIAFHAMRLLDI